MKNETNEDDVSLALASATKKHIAPILRVNPMKVAFLGSKGATLDQGTITFVKYQDRFFGLTNSHVVGDLTRPRADAAFLLALNKHTPLPGRLIFSSNTQDIDFPFDVAVFLLDKGTIEEAGKEFIELKHQSCPVREETKYLAAGYPGAHRREVEEQSFHPIFHIVTTCVLSSDRKLVFQDEIPESELVMRFGGISGGAIFDVADDDEYSLVGLVFEGRGHDDVVEEQVSSNDIWLYGIPLSTTLMDRILAKATDNGESLDLQPLSFKVSIEIDPNTSTAPPS